MVLPKSTVHVSRLAGTALKSFTHGYAQTVVAASQSSYASQNTPVAPLASNFLSRFKDKSGKHTGQHAQFSSLAANQQAADAASGKHDSNHDSALAHFHEAWQKHHKVESKDWHSHHITKRVGWKAPTTIPEPTPAEVKDAEAHITSSPTVTDSSKLKRSYSTSAVDNFAKAIDNEEAEAIAIAQVNEAIAEEISRNRKSVDGEVQAVASEVAQKVQDVAQPAARNESWSVASDFHTSRLAQLLQDGYHAQIPSAFEAMLRDGVQQPPQPAYRALLVSALELTENKHQKAPRVLDIYADMMKRKVIPDSETMTIIVDALAARAFDSAESSALLAQKHARFGRGSTIFSLEGLEHKIMSEDQTLDIALRFLETSPLPIALPVATYESLIKASATRGRTSGMIALYSAMTSAGFTADSSIYPIMISAFGKIGDLRNAVAAYDDYRSLAIANNAGELGVKRLDGEVYASLIQAYGNAGSLDKGKKLLARIETDEESSAAAVRSRDAILANGLLPFELNAGNFTGVYAIVNHLSPRFYAKALELIAKTTADQGNLMESVQAFDALAQIQADLTASATAIFGLHLRTNNVEAGDRYFAVLEQSAVNLETMQMSVLRAVAFISLDQASRGLQPARHMVAKFNESVPANSAGRAAALERVEEAIEALAQAVFNGSHFPVSTAAAAEVLRIMSDNSVIIAHYAEAMLASLNGDQIASMSAPDLDVFVQTQARLLLDESSRDIAAPTRFSCMLESIAARSVLPGVTTENLIEKALVNLNRSDLSQLWNNYRYPSSVAFSPAVDTPITSNYNSFSPHSTSTPPTLFDDSFDPYIAQTDHKGSVVITDILDRSTAKPISVLNEALSKFRNIRRAGRHPRFFAYSKLVQAAAKANQLDTASAIVEMAKQDVPLMPQYRIVRHGWIAILDSMVAACITCGRRDLAARYHQDLLEMGAAPSANTFGLYITSLKETTRTFDEASEAVKIFLRSKAEGVEPSSFLYNALIGKLGKARRIDDCLFYFAEMRNLGIRPTSVTYGTIVNALCRVSDEKFAEEIFEEMEQSANYKPRPAPYHSLMQFFLTTKRDRAKVLAYYERMRGYGIQPTMHTYKLLIDAHATIEPVQMGAAEGVLAEMEKSGTKPEAVHFASLIHAKGCVMHDLTGARALFDSVLADPGVRVQPCLYQAMLEGMVANKRVSESEELLVDMAKRRVEVTPYIVNALVHGWTGEKNITKAEEAYKLVDVFYREPSTYEAMVRAYLAVEDRSGAERVVAEALGRGYPSAVAAKIAELVGGGRS